MTPSAKFGKWMLCLIVLISEATQFHGQPAQKESGELRLHIVSSEPRPHRPVPAVIWLEAASGTPPLSFPPQGRYTLLQKNRMFTPHLLVIPVGAVVQFPNADPFFHNVFSLYNGRRFDLGLYEAGSSKSVTFFREGVSYIFCNIHPEMSAVVLALSSPLYAIADASDSFVLRDIPQGSYKLHLWVEGVPQSFLDGLGRTVYFPPHVLNLGNIKVPLTQAAGTSHTNKFGDPYTPDPQSIY